MLPATPNISGSILVPERARHPTTGSWMPPRFLVPQILMRILISPDATAFRLSEAVCSYRRPMIRTPAWLEKLTGLLSVGQLDNMYAPRLSENL